MTKAPELKPCPFCGGEAELFNRYVSCCETGCEMCLSDLSDVKFSPEEWNTRADLHPVVKPLEWVEGAPVAKPVPYQIWSNNGGSGAPDDPLIQYENFMAFDPFMQAIGEFELYEDAEQACEEHWQSFMAGNIDLAPVTPAQAAKRRVRHIKRGTTYEVIGSGKIQTDRPLTDYAEVTVYRGEKDGMVWIRPVDEFEDPDRFEDLPALRAIAEGGA